MTNKPWVIVVSGPNGAGKSTFYKKILSQNPFLANAEFINYDDTYANLQQTNINSSPVILRRQALSTVRYNIDSAFLNKKNIIFETTGAGIKQVQKQAIQNDYKIYGLHITLKAPELSIARVKHRVKNGGHDVPLDVIFERFNDNKTTLINVLPLENVGIVIDNSGHRAFMPIFVLANRRIASITKCPDFLQETYDTLCTMFPPEPIQNLLQTPQDVNINKMSENQREIFGQVIISQLLNQIQK